MVTENRLMVARAGGWGRREQYFLLGSENVLELGSGDHCTVF